MIRLTIVYPRSAGTFFDFQYYLTAHLPLSARLLHAHGFLGYEVQRGDSTVQGEDPPYLCITQLEFSALAGLQAGMAEHGAELRADFARYTDIVPVATVCTVVESQRLA